MIFSITRLSLTAAAMLLPICVQAVAFTDDTFDGIAVGVSKELTWSGDNNPVTIKLMQGDPKTLESVVTVASGVSGGSYTWVPRTIVPGKYCLSITQGSETNYSPMFSISGTGPPGGAPAPVNKASSAAGPALAPSKASAPKASHHPFLPSAVIVAHQSPFPASDVDNGSDNDGQMRVCGFDDDSTGSFRCAENMQSDVGRYRNSGAVVGGGMKGVGLVWGVAVMVGVGFGMV